MKDETKLKEHGEGFLSREKIARTPPEDEGRRPQGQYNSSLGQYYNDGSGSMGSQQYGAQDFYPPVVSNSGKKAASYKLGKGVALLDPQQHAASANPQQL